MTALLLDAVRHAFRDRPALTGLSLHVAPGEVVALIGLNGAGKTTALRVLTGRLRPAAGTARVLGRDPARLDAATARRFGHVVGTPLASPDLTVAENLRVAALLHGLPDRAARGHAPGGVRAGAVGRAARGRRVRARRRVRAAPSPTAGRARSSASRRRAAR